MPCVITLTTDFGRDSTYVAQMKGVILSRNPAVAMVDLTHAIPPQDVARGALALEDAAHWFPAETIHLAVVDPGVGAERRLVYARIGEQHYLAPDNGLLWLVARRTRPERIVTLTEPRFWSPEVSHTFHGRDILAPVAAHLSLGVNSRALGPPQAELMPLVWPAVRMAPGEVTGSVVAIDPFGNVITNITSDDLRRAGAGGAVRVTCRGRTVNEMVTTYGRSDAGTLVALVGSSGRLELAVVNGDAGKLLGAQTGDEIAVRFSASAAR